LSRCEAGKIFLLGVGAQKCGTTWLESELSGTSWFSNGGIKEFHVFNKLVAQRRNNPAKAMIRRRRKGKLDLIRLQEAMRLSESPFKFLTVINSYFFFFFLSRCR